MPEYLTILHVYHNSSDDIAAIAEADDIKISMESNLLDTEEKEGVDIIETIPLGIDPTPTAAVTTLRRARNILVRSRVRECWDYARNLDELIFQFEKRALNPNDFRHAGYDWSNFMKVTKEILDGGNPLDH